MLRAKKALTNGSCFLREASIQCIIRIRISLGNFIVQLKMTLSGQVYSFCILNGMGELRMKAWKDFMSFYSTLDFFFYSNRIHQQHIQQYELDWMDQRMKKRLLQFHYHHQPQHEFLNVCNHYILLCCNIKYLLST